MTQASGRTTEYAETENTDQKGLLSQSGTKQPHNPGTASDEEAKVLFESYKMGPFTLANRLVYAPLTRCRAYDTIPQEHMVKYYEQRAIGSEGGLILSEGTSPSTTGYGYPHTPGIHTKEQTDKWKPIVAAVKKHNAIFFCQLWHVGRQSHNDYQPNGAKPLAPSAIAVKGEIPTPSGMKPYPEPQALTKEGIQELVHDYRQAARNSINAGFDGVEIHSANGYVLEEFIKDSSNKRTDEYGGSEANRCRVVLEVVEAVTNEIGADRVGIRFSPYSTFGDINDSNPNHTYGYLTEQLNKYGLAYVHFVEPRIAGNQDKEVTEEGHDLSIFRKKFQGTFIAAGGFNRETAIDAVKSGHADLICFGRKYLSNPDLPKRFKKNTELNPYNRDTFYTQDPVKGYTDYPFLSEE
eukprot:jgi/Astpho2/4653/Aster-00219